MGELGFETARIEAGEDLVLFHLIAFIGQDFGDSPVFAGSNFGPFAGAKGSDDPVGALARNELYGGDNDVAWRWASGWRSLILLCRDIGVLEGPESEPDAEAKKGEQDEKAERGSPLLLSFWLGIGVCCRHEVCELVFVEKIDDHLVKLNK